MKLLSAIVATGCCAAPAMAQDRVIFTGPSAGIGAGYLEHHFGLEVEASQNGELISRQDYYERSHGVGAVTWVGHDWAISPRGRIGVELEGNVGGRTTSFDGSEYGLPGGRYEQTPRWGVHGTVRAGYLLTDRLMPYASAGYGGNRYRVRDGVGLGDGNSWGSSFVVSAGVEYRASDRIGVRLDGKHVDNQTWQLMLGVPICI